MGPLAHQARVPEPGAEEAPVVAPPALVIKPGGKLPLGIRARIAADALGPEG